ncbi:hypothetical protein DUZ99_02280 [Xylanibacillus composti]|uniref:Uncharacterized protein n=1 Tax=Xylanibacillus composti TaxID=1572762 RepID=A0A8J4M0S9_9BACL|nr:hypothetical protein [Xylanibacillus composti]MDT9723823.1 hypothetical protein [Xylanibacillus composti]GIQ67400.1 hypothetical protein XYCOK13_02240 [Xylanibacillus composti]
MSDKIELKTFPTSKVTALTMLYLEKQDLSDITPEELADKYSEVYIRINKRFSEQSRDAVSKWI